MFGITEKLKNAAAAGATMAFAIGLALLGMVWLSIAGFTALAAYVPEAAAMCIVGFAAMAPLVIMLLRNRAAASSSPKSNDPEPAADTPQEVSAIVRLAHSASLLAERSPVAGVALTLAAAFMASRSPATTPLAMLMLAETVERWAQRPQEPPPAPADGNADGN